CGEVSERLKEPASKAGSLAKPGSWVQIPPSPPWLPTFYLRWNLASVGNLGLALYAPHARRGSSNPTLSAMVAHLLLRWNLASVGNLGLALYAPHARRGGLIKSHPLRHGCPPFTYAGI